MKRILKGILVIELIFGIGSVACAANGDGMIYAGTAKTDITPSEDAAVNLVGQKLKIRDHIFARVLVLKNETTSLAIVSLDLIVFASEKVVAEAKAKWNLDHVILCSTHTHSGMAPKGLVLTPNTSNDWTRAGDPEKELDWAALSEDPWYAATEDKIVAAIGEATKNFFPAKIEGARGSAENAYMAHNRRLVHPDGSESAMWDNPNRLPTQPIDPTLGVLRVSDANGKPRAFLVNYACHAVATSGSGLLTRDFPGAFVDYIEEQLGPDCMAMFVQGAEGDQDPYDMKLPGEHGFNVVKQAGISLGKKALLVAKTLDAQPAAQKASLKIMESALDIPYRNGKDFSKVVLTTVVINNSIAFTTVPGEPFVQHQMNLRAKSPLADTSIIALAYSGSGTPFTVYIPTVQAVKEGGYGATECSYLAANAGDLIVDEAAASIKELLAK